MPFLLMVASLTPKSYSFMIGTKTLRMNSLIRTSDHKLRSLSVMSHDISKPETERLIKQANAWCALNGLLYSAEDSKFTMAPVALVPNTFSKSAFEYAQNVQPILNELVDILSRDKDFLLENLASVCESDDFVRRLLGRFCELEYLSLPLPL
jgi:Eukaryotic glutathione synthase, ATP binding domain